MLPVYRISTYQVIRMHNAFVNNKEIRDLGLLESAVESVFQSFCGLPLYSTVECQAAMLAYHLIENHPFVDGNKRIALHTMLVLLKFHGIEIEYTQEEAVDLILRTAKSEINGDDILEWIISHKKADPENI